MPPPMFHVHPNFKTLIFSAQDLCYKADFENRGLNWRGSAIISPPPPPGGAISTGFPSTSRSKPWRASPPAPSTCSKRSASPGGRSATTTPVPASVSATRGVCPPTKRRPFAPAVRLDWRQHVSTDARLLRPTDLAVGIADPRKARETLGWQAQFRMGDVVRMMAEAEMEKRRACAVNSQLIAQELLPCRPLTSDLRPRAVRSCRSPAQRPTFAVSV